eukprot:6090053-Pyramimonas_sp.AAC.1
MRAVTRARQCTGPHLNLAKCEIVHAREMSDDEFVALFRTAKTNVRSSKHGTYGKALGVDLGPGGYMKYWKEPASKYMCRVRHARSRNLGLTGSIYACNSLAFSALSLVTQMRPPPKIVHAAEARGRQVLTACPYYSIPTDLLRQLDSLHWPVVPRHVMPESKAATFRVAAKSKVFNLIQEKVSE